MVKTLTWLALVWTLANANINSADLKSLIENVASTSKDISSTDYYSRSNKNPNWVTTHYEIDRWNSSPFSTCWRWNKNVCVDVKYKNANIDTTPVDYKILTNSEIKKYADSANEVAKILNKNKQKVYDKIDK